jgi:hypothetical protein
MTQDEQRGGRLRRILAVVAVLLALGGGTALTVALTSQQHAPQPPASAAGSSSSAPASPAQAIPAGPSGAPGSAAAGAAPTLPAADPVHLDVPAIGVSSDLLSLGLNPDNTVEVPPLSADSRAGWYRYSPSPGELGPSVILGHVDSAEYGPGVFFDLGALKPGDTITVTRDDHTAATFQVDRVASYPKDQFPTLDVYGNTDDAELRLITCGGDFDSSARSYLDNIVVYASLTGSSAA